MKEIGGYFGLEELEGMEYYPDLIALNTGRNALLYICLVKGIRELFLPYFLCSCVYDMCRSHGIGVSFYHVDENFLPLFEEEPCDGQAVYVVNYYGQLDCETLRQLQNRYGRLILDNTHAFFQRPVFGIDTIYSCRKFFGVPDGAYLATGKKLNQVLEREEVRENMEHILGRYEKSASEFYQSYQKNDDRFYHAPLRKMSKISSNILRGIDYEGVLKKRTENFQYLNQKLEGVNLKKNKIPLGPFAYPLYCKDGMNVRRKLAERKIYVPTLWPNVLRLENCPVEKDLAENILPLPCDQRYDVNDMESIMTILREIEAV